MLPIPAFMLLCMVFIVLAGTAAAIMPFPSLELLPVDELLSVLYAANSSHSDESCEQPNIPASVSGERGEEDSARVAEALQNFLNTGETVNLEKCCTLLTCLHCGKAAVSLFRRRRIKTR